MFKEESPALLGTGPDSETVAGSVAAATQDVQAMSMSALRTEWQRLYRSIPPRRISRDLLVRAVAWKRQDLSCGVRATPTIRRLKKLAEVLDANGTIGEPRSPTLRPGARLLREWRGTTHTVTVVDDGFEWQGGRYRSLSEIAGLITGTHWSGPRFFGLKGGPPRAEPKEARDE